jgi:hypothetical protein
VKAKFRERSTATLVSKGVNSRGANWRSGSGLWESKGTYRSGRKSIATSKVGAEPRATASDIVWIFVDHHAYGKRSTSGGLLQRGSNKEARIRKELHKSSQYGRRVEWIIAPQWASRCDEPPTQNRVAATSVNAIPETGEGGQQLFPSLQFLCIPVHVSAPLLPKPHQKRFGSLRSRTGKCFRRVHGD